MILFVFIFFEGTEIHRVSPPDPLRRSAESGIQTIGTQYQDALQAMFMAAQNALDKKSELEYLMTKQQKQ